MRKSKTDFFLQQRARNENNKKTLNKKGKNKKEKPSKKEGE